MGARWQQQKLRKIKLAQKKQRAEGMKGGKTFYRTHSYNPTAMIVDDGGNPVAASLGARAKAVITNPWLEQLFPGKNSLADGNAVIAKALNGNPRAVVLQKLLNGDVPLALHKSATFAFIINSKFKKLRLYMCGTQVFFVEEIIRGGTRECRRSVMYTSPQEANIAYGYGRICWVEPTVELNILPDD